MAWGVRERGGDQLTVWEAFKVYDGQIHAVEAFMRILPLRSATAGGSNCHSRLTSSSGRQRSRRWQSGNCSGSPAVGRVVA
jgi:hypothetical protein